MIPFPHSGPVYIGSSHLHDSSLQNVGKGQMSGVISGCPVAGSVLAYTVPPKSHCSPSDACTTPSPHRGVITPDEQVQSE